MSNEKKTHPKSSFGHFLDGMAKGERKPIVVERFADNGEHSHYELIDHDGKVLWTEYNQSPTITDEMIKTAAQEYGGGYGWDAINFEKGAKWAIERLRSEREKDAIDFLDFSVRNYTYDYSDSGDVWYEHGTDKKLTKEQLHTIYVNEKNGKK